jgi:hypothetical protein
MRDQRLIQVGSRSTRRPYRSASTYPVTPAPDGQQDFAAAGRPDVFTGGPFSFLGHGVVSPPGIRVTCPPARTQSVTDLGGNRWPARLSITTHRAIRHICRCRQTVS